MTTLVVHPAQAPLAGSVPVPADPDVAHLSLVLAALASGVTRVAGIGAGHPAEWTADCLRALGVAVAAPPEAPRGGRGAGELLVRGVGLGGLRAPAGPLDAGASAATLRLLAALLAGQHFAARVTGQAALAQAAVAAAPLLRARGAIIEGTPLAGGVVAAPITVGPLPEARRLTGIEHAVAAPSAELKTALLLSGLFADGPTFFQEPMVSADHAERLLQALGAPVHTAGPAVQLDAPGMGWDGALPAFDMDVPGDLSAAAFLLAAAQVVGGSRVTVRAVGVNPTRTGWLEIARDMGAGVAIEPLGERCGEPVADVHAWSAPLAGTAIGGETLVRAGADVVPAAVLAARATGRTRILGASGTSAVATVLRAFGVACEPAGAALAIEGRPGPLEAAEVEARGDAALAMGAAVLALAARGPSVVRDAGCIRDRYPKFVATLRALGARVDVTA